MHPRSRLLLIMAGLSLPLALLVVDYNCPGPARPTELVEAPPGRAEHVSGRVVRLTRVGETAVLVLEDRRGRATCTFTGPDPGWPHCGPAAGRV